MRILVACEYSGRVRDEFIARGHDAISCDILPTENPGPHYQGDVRDILHNDYDMIIAFPPCTYLSQSGVQHLYYNRKKENGYNMKRLDEMYKAARFFNLFLDHKCEKICIENLVQHGWARSLIRKYDQIIQPWQFGDEATKKTCLWFKGLPKLEATNIVSPGKRYIDKTGKKNARIGVR